MPLLAVSDFFVGPNEKMDLGWACMRLIYVISVLKPENDLENVTASMIKVLDLCLLHSPTSVASLMILNIASIGKIIFLFIII